MNKIIVLVSVCLLTLSSHAQDIPQREFRGIWVATVGNIDWPSKSGLPPADLKREFYSILDLHKKNGMNALFVQVRPSADAFYESRYEPWSKWLSGKLGNPPDPYFDPLEFMVTASHEYGFEFHAWFNPYRAIVDVDKNGIDSASVVARNPGWFLKYGSNMYFDPGLPMARRHTIAVIMEVVNRYKIDGVHFDDYFYPYKIKDQEFPDSTSFKNYGAGFSNKDDWRRNNVNVLIKELSDSIRKVRPYLHFGVSPFGVWRNADKDPSGSKTRAGQTCYDDLYADILKWEKEKWIDYVLPQIYWPIGFEVANYEVIAKWWNENSFGVPVYIGHGAYRIGSADERWKNPKQIPDQIRLNRSLENIKGSAFFSSKSFKSNPLAINDTLRLNAYRYKALPIETHHTTFNDNRRYPLQFIGGQGGITLLWKEEGNHDELNIHHRYVVYRVYKSKAEVIAILPAFSGYTMQSYQDTSAKHGRKYSYAVTSVDLFNHESTMKEYSAIVNKKSSWKVYKK